MTKITFQDGHRSGPYFNKKLLQRVVSELHLCAHMGGFPSAPYVFKMKRSTDSARSAPNKAVGLSYVGLDFCWTTEILKMLLSASHWFYVLRVKC